MIMNQHKSEYAIYTTSRVNRESPPVLKEECRNKKEAEMAIALYADEDSVVYIVDRQGNIQYKK